MGGLCSIYSRIDGFRSQNADAVHKCQIAGMAAFAVRKRVAVGRAMGMSRADDNIFGGKARNAGAHPITKDGWEPKKVEGYDCDSDIFSFEENRSRSQVALFLAR